MNANVQGAVRLLEEKGWTTGAFARDAHGVPCSPLDPAATCFCMLGAVIAADPSGWSDAVRLLEVALQEEYGMHFNDRCTEVGQVIEFMLRCT